MQISPKEAAYMYAKTGEFMDWLNDMSMTYMRMFWTEYKHIV